VSQPFQASNRNSFLSFHIQYFSKKKTGGMGFDKYSPSDLDNYSFSIINKG